jgi:ABC-type transporter Mla subunit MlaD
MAQRKQLTWMELRVGLFVLVGLAVLAAGIFYVTGGESFGPKYRLIT